MSGHYCTRFRTKLKLKLAIASSLQILDLSLQNARIIIFTQARTRVLTLSLNALKETLIQGQRCTHAIASRCPKAGGSVCEFHTCASSRYLHRWTTSRVYKWNSEIILGIQISPVSRSSSSWSSLVRAADLGSNETSSRLRAISRAWYSNRCCGEGCYRFAIHTLQYTIYRLE